MHGSPSSQSVGPLHGTMPPPPPLLDEAVDELPVTLELDEEPAPAPPPPSDSSEGAPRYVRLHAPDAAIPNAAVKIAKK